MINDIHSIINFATDKGVTGYHKPEDIDNEIHAVSTDLWQKFFDQYAITKKISSYMSPFEVVDIDLVVSTLGKVVMIKEIVHPTLVLDSITSKEIHIRERYQWGKEINDPIAFPTTDYPICLFADKTDNKFNVEVLPVEIEKVTIYGLKKPAKPVWTYTIGSDGRRVFDATATNPDGGTYQDIEWSELLFNDIRNRVLKVMGINLRESHITQFAEQMKAETE